MEYFSDDHSKLLLSKEWLVKIDSDKSVPYMLKFYSSTVDLCCYILITDTKNVWGEVLQSNQLARRWRGCNSQHAPFFDTDEDEDEWRTAIVELLSAAHTIGGMEDLSFEVVKTHYSDLAFQLSSDTFKWRWETYAVGPILSAEILSQHLIMPLVSLTHLAFTSADPVSELSDADLEKAVDKIGRTARRTTDTHVKHAISRPRAATTLRRMTAMFNFTPDLPPIVSEAPKSDLRLPSTRPRSRAASKAPRRPLLPIWEPTIPVIEVPPRAVSPSPTDVSLHQPARAVDDSETESEPEDAPDEPGLTENKAADDGPVRRFHRSPSPSSSKSLARASPGASRQQSPAGMGVSTKAAKSSTDDSSPPHSPPTKKSKRVESSDEEDSEAERRRRVAQIKSKAQRGAKQPLKRGGKRF